MSSKSIRDKIARFTACLICNREKYNYGDVQLLNTFYTVFTVVCAYNYGCPVSMYICTHVSVLKLSNYRQRQHSSLAG